MILMLVIRGAFSAEESAAANLPIQTSASLGIQNDKWKLGFRHGNRPNSRQLFFNRRIYFVFGEF